MPTLPLEKSIGEVILDIIKSEPKSISGITRELRGSGINAHKLVITGYLKALNDLGYVRERDLPPLKIYSSSVPHKKDIYEFIGEKIEVRRFVRFALGEGIEKPQSDLAAEVAEEIAKSEEK